MTITYHPQPGQILLCDFSAGFKEPEMVKTNRPVVVLTGAIKGRSNLVTVVPLSTVSPEPPQRYHYKIPKASMPMLSMFQQNDSWVKGDMIYTFGFHRFNSILLKRGLDNKREYFRQRLGREQMQQIYKCVLYGLNLGYLEQYINRH
jgi:mRNA interferase MazF